MHQPGAAGNAPLPAQAGRRGELPGHGVGEESNFLPGAYLVDTVEHIYTRVEAKGSRPQEARFTKAVAQVTSLNPTLTE